MDFAQQIAGVAITLALLGGALWWLRRHGYASLRTAARNGRRLEVIERLPLGPQHTLHLVRLDSQFMLLACSPGGCSLVRAIRAASPEGGDA